MISTSETNTAAAPVGGGTLKRIKSIALYPEQHGYGGRTIGGANAHRYHHNSPDWPITGPWPALTVGEEIEIEDDHGWLWSAIVDVIQSADSIQIRVIGDKTALPMPPVISGQPYRLPNMSGHAHSRRWKLGSITRIDGQSWRVAKQPRPVKPDHGKIEYILEPATAEQYASRSGEIKMSDQRAAQQSIGSAVQVRDEWLHVTSIDGPSYGSAEGEYFGTTWYGVGRFVAADKAAKLNAAHCRAADEKRWGGKEGLAARDAYDAAIAAIPADYGRRHGATLGGEWSIGSSGGVEPSVASATPHLGWSQIARKHQPGGSPGVIGETWVLTVASTAYGTVYREEFAEYDNYRTTLWMPPALYEQHLSAEVERLGITPDSARQWLAESRGCVGTELYEFAAREQS